MKTLLKKVLRIIKRRIKSAFLIKNPPYSLPISEIDYSNIIDLGGDKQFYYGEIKRQEFLMLLSEISNSGDNASDVIKRYCQYTNNSYFFEYAIGNKRGLAISLFENLENKHVLDYGCGLGSLGIEAIKKGARVTFADSSWDRLKMASYLTAEFSDVSKHKFVALNDIRRIYELNETYDLIILNGLLEWLPSVAKGSFSTAQEIQVDFLRICIKLLNDNGRIFIGMENRFALIYQLGYPEDHTEIIGLSLLDRDIANEKHKEIKNTEFVNFTWSYFDYYHYAKTIGMEVEKITGMFPDYRFPQKIVDLNNCDNEILTKCFSLERLIFPSIIDYSEYIKYLGIIDTLKYYVYSYGVILKKI